MILGLDTSTSSAWIGILKGGKPLAEKRWEAGRELSKQLLPELAKLLASQKIGWGDLEGVVIFEGPGSFTGLRIGFTTANTIAYSLGIPIATASGNNWAAKAVTLLRDAKSGTYALPRYGAEAKITLPKPKIQG